MISNSSCYEFTNVNPRYITGVNSTTPMFMRLEHIYWWNELTRTAEVCGSLIPRTHYAYYDLGLGSKDSVNLMVPSIDIFEKRYRPPYFGFAERLNDVITQEYYLFSGSLGREQVFAQWNDSAPGSAEIFRDAIATKITPLPVAFDESIVVKRKTFNDFHDAMKKTIAFYGGDSYPTGAIYRNHFQTGIGYQGGDYGWWDMRSDRSGHAFSGLFDVSNGRWDGGSSPEYAYWHNQGDVHRPFLFAHNYPYAIDTGVSGMYFRSQIAGRMNGTWVWEDDKSYTVPNPPWSWSRGSSSGADDLTFIEIIVLYRLVHRAMWTRPSTASDYIFVSEDHKTNTRYVLCHGSYWSAENRAGVLDLHNFYDMTNKQIGDRCCEVVNVDSLPSEGPISPESGWTKAGYQVYVDPYAVAFFARASGRGIGD